MESPLALDTTVVLLKSIRKLQTLNWKYWYLQSLVGRHLCKTSFSSFPQLRTVKRTMTLEYSFLEINNDWLHFHSFLI